MGSMVIQCNDPTMQLPKVFSNSHGFESWSGVHANQVTPEILEQVLKYCDDEGYRVGWNEANQEFLLLSDYGPFHAALLDGRPYKAWATSYARGAAEAKEFKTGRAD